MIDEVWVRKQRSVKAEFPLSVLLVSEDGLRITLLMNMTNVLAFEQNRTHNLDKLFGFSINYNGK